MTTQRERKKTS